MKKNYAGLLRKKIRAPREPGLIESAMPAAMKDYHAQETNRVRHEFELRMSALAGHYGIKETGNHYKELSLALAMEHVPGFSFEKERGAPGRWSGLLQAGLVVEMHALTAQDPKKSQRQAARQLSKRLPWSRLVQGSDAPDDLLLNAYKKGKKDPALVQIMTAIRSGSAPGADNMNYADMLEELVSDACRDD